MRILVLLFLLIVLIGCGSSKKTYKLSETKLKDDSIKFWYHKDYFLDKVPGISLDKWYTENSQTPQIDSITVAVLDTQIDTDHEDLKGQIWVNPNEIKNNGIDDDKNGYVDDSNGWNFLGTISGKYIVWSNYEYVRIVRNYDTQFKEKKEEELSDNERNKFKEYKAAYEKLTKNRQFYGNWLKSLQFNIEKYSLVKDTLKHFFPGEKYTYEQLDSLYKKYKINDKKYRQRRDDNDTDLGALISYMMVNFGVKHFTLDDIKNQESQIDSVYNKNLNVDYNERNYIDYGSEDLKPGYGNNNVNQNINGIRRFYTHSTEVSGLIASNRENEKGIKGFSDRIKIMPLCISPSGDEHDKDIATAIYYAVDNGAKIVNMSFSKEFSLYKEWVFDAMKYAEQHNVLIVHCSGNDNYDIDINPKYPNDNDYNDKTEVSQNFINVGSISQKMDSTFVSSFSNYGKENVDLFAPGEEIYTTIPENKYDYDSGTSLSAPMVSGTAALIWSYYPNLTVQEVKQIIMESGTSYDIEVLVPGGEGKKVPFKELSKSGKVLNVYNAMKMAKEISKGKR